MARRNTSWLALTLAGLLLGLGGLALFLRQPPRAEPGDVRSAPVSAADDVGDAGAARRAPAPLERPDDPAARAAELPRASTTVLWPLEVELELERGARLPDDPLAGPLGAGRDARLKGRVADARGLGTPVAVTFLAGPNAGRVIRSDSNGEFGATDLYPGVSVVEVSGPGILGSRREVILSSRSETLLNIGYGRTAIVGATVRDEAGDPIEGARVSVDGQVAFSDANGEIYIPAVASGPALVEVTREGYASYREKLNITAAAVLTADRIQFTLSEGVRLGVEVVGVAAGSGPVRGFLLPANPLSQRTYPWHALNPIDLYPGSVNWIEDLPEELVTLRVFRDGARAEPDALQVNLRAGRSHQATVHLLAAPVISGVVTRDGRPVPGATVRLEAPDRVQAAARYFRRPTSYLESEVIDDLPPFSQDLVTDAEGRFAFTAWEEVADRRYLTATGPEGRTWAGRVVATGEGDDAGTEVELALEPLEDGDGLLVLELPGRTQGLVCEVTVDGAVRDPVSPPPDRPLEIDDLVEGTWRLAVRWHGQVLFEESGIEVLPEAVRRIELPEEAIVGQDREDWKRAGREWPE